MELEEEEAVAAAEEVAAAEATEDELAAVEESPVCAYDPVSLLPSLSSRFLNSQKTN